MWLSVEMQWHGPGHLCIRIHLRHVTSHMLKSYPFLHLILCLPLVIDFCLKERYRRGSERSSGARWQFCAWRKADSAQTSASVWSEGRRWPHFIYTRRLIYLPAKRLGVHAKIPSRKRAHNRPSSAKKKLWIISCTVDIIKCCCLVFMRYLQRAASMAEAYHPLVQMLWEVFKGFASFREEGAVQPLWSVPLSAVKMFGPCDATAALHRRSLHPLSSLQPPPHPRPKALSRNNGHKGLRVL